jgi:hypothetical protein
MADYTLNINLNSGMSGAGAVAPGVTSNDVKMLSGEIRTVRGETEAYRAKFESYVNNLEEEKEADEEERRQRASALREANRQKEKLIKKKKIERTAAISAVALTLDAGRFASFQESAIYQNKAAANEISNAVTTVGVAAGAGAVGVNIAKAAASGNYVLAAIDAVVALGATVISLTQKLEQWDYNQAKNTANETRSSDRLGIVISQRNRMR